MTIAQRETRLARCVSNGYDRHVGVRMWTGRTAMTTILDLKATLAKMPTMTRAPTAMTEAERKATGAFVTLAPYPRRQHL